jgi:hypothetical protein
LRPPEREHPGGGALRASQPERTERALQLPSNAASLPGVRALAESRPHG